MFGYVRAYAPEMKICEYEYYRAAYCGLCRANGRCTGQCSRLLLNYDFAFIALVRLALTGESPGFRRARCLAHPSKKKLEMTECQTLDICAYASALLNYHKVLDDLADEHGRKRLRARVMMPLLSGMRKKAMSALPGLDETIAAHLADLAGLEREGCASVDLPAECFGRLCADIFSYRLDKNIPAARAIGMHIGKWIYIADALDDYADDLHSGSYNPLCRMYPDGMDQSASDAVRTALTHELMDAELAFDLLEYDDKRLRGVVENIIYCGMTHRARSLGDKKRRQRKEPLQDE